MKADTLRKKFLDFFKNKKHRVIESDSLLPQDDPTVLFTPAGMNQFKKEFMGFDSGYKRAATSQRCLRTDDLDKVGKTSGHHTLFEMLGNFSFGDYFKKEAITWAWEFLTQELKIDQKRLWVSVYKDDAEAYGIWLGTIGIPVNKIVKLGDKENFWPSQAKENGPNGPCGPCSEIFYDFGKKPACNNPECSPACDCGRFVEIWNLVFTQFERKDGGVLLPLPNKNIDTGMGLERLTALMQGKENNFGTDLFQPIIALINSNLPPQAAGDPGLLYALADHIRAVTFTIYDGILPSNESRGYVVRKLIRRSILHLKALGIKPPFLYTLVGVVAAVMKEPYPELTLKREDIAQVVLAEEEGFLSVLNSSPTLFQQHFSRFKKTPDPVEAGKIVFKLHDTYGLPVELTGEWLKQHSIAYSQESFDKELLAQKDRSKAKSAMKGDVFDAKDSRLDVKNTKFAGYQKLKLESKILKIFIEGRQAGKLSQGQEARIILETTPFYAESGGQAGDRGRIQRGNNIFEVSDTQKAGKVILHIGKVIKGGFKKDALVQAEVNYPRRLAIMRNHTATHLLQSALRKVLGAHVKQQGSLVAEEKLRFDFTHFKALGKEELDRIEGLVNNYILENHPLKVEQLDLGQAKKTGALAFFGDKYDKRVRVVSIADFSKEFCGGTHLSSSGQIGLFKIIREESVAAGVRRIEAVSASAAYRVLKERDDQVQSISQLLNVPVDKLTIEVAKRILRIKELEKLLSTQRERNLASSSDDLIQSASVINGITVLTQVTQGQDMDDLRKSADIIKQKVQSKVPLAVIALGADVQGKAMLVVALTKDLSDKGLDAGALVRRIAPIIGGSGGGRKDFAQAGGNAPENFEKAFEELKIIARELS